MAEYGDVNLSSYPLIGLSHFAIYIEDKIIIKYVSLISIHDQFNSNHIHRHIFSAVFQRDVIWY